MNRYMLLFSWTLLTSGMRIDHAFDDIPTFLDAVTPKRSQRTGFDPVCTINFIHGQKDEAYASVNLVLQHSAIDLGAIDDISGVDCSEDSLSISFASREAYDTGVGAWAPDPYPVFVTNHPGNCNANDERGFYTVESAEWDETSHTFKAKVVKKNPIDVASSIHANFSGFRFQQQNDDAYFGPEHWDSISTSLAGQPVSDPPVVIGKTEQGFFNTNFSYSGELFHITGQQRPNILYIDVNITSADGVPLQINVTGPYSQTVLFQEESINSYIYAIPGVLSIQPSLRYTGGAGIEAVSATTARTNLTSDLVDGHIHLDLVNAGNARISGLWDGNYASSVAIDSVASIRVSPYITIIAIFAVNITGISDTLTQGFQSTTTSSYDFQLNGTDNVCTRTSYGYSVDAFSYQGFLLNLFSRQDPFTTGCG